MGGGESFPSLRWACGGLGGRAMWVDMNSAVGYEQSGLTAMDIRGIRVGYGPGATMQAYGGGL